MDKGWKPKGKTTKDGGVSAGQSQLKEGFRGDKQSKDTISGHTYTLGYHDKLAVFKPLAPKVLPTWKRSACGTPAQSWTECQGGST